MTLTNLRKWLPIYKAAKTQIDIDKKMCNSWIKAYDNFDRLLWGAFEGIIHFAWYDKRSCKRRSPGFQSLQL